MSYEFSAFEDYGYTDDEIAIGARALLYGYDEEYFTHLERMAPYIQEEVVEKEKIEQIQQEESNNKKDNLSQSNNIESEIITLIAGCKDNSKIQDKAIKKLFEINLEYMIGIYSKVETLTYDYVYLAKQENCINILIKNFLKKNAGYTLSSQFVETINTFTENIYKNATKDIIYERVHQIQKIIHNKVDEKKGDGAHKKLPGKKMKDLLSTARLHLNLEDIKHEKIDILIDLIKKSEHASINEAKHPQKIILEDLGISYIHHKRARDMKSLIDFGYFNIASKIIAIANLDKNKTVDEFKNEVIQIYSDNRRCTYGDAII